MHIIVDCVIYPSVFKVYLLMGAKSSEDINVND